MLICFAIHLSCITLKLTAKVWSLAVQNYNCLVKFLIFSTIRIENSRVVIPLSFLVASFILWSFAFIFTTLYVDEY